MTEAVKIKPLQSNKNNDKVIKMMKTMFTTPLMTVNS